MLGQRIDLLSSAISDHVNNYSDAYRLFGIKQVTGILIGSLILYNNNPIFRYTYRSDYTSIIKDFKFYEFDNKN